MPGNDPREELVRVHGHTNGLEFVGKPMVVRITKDGDSLSPMRAEDWNLKARGGKRVKALLKAGAEVAERRKRRRVVGGNDATKTLATWNPVEARKSKKGREHGSRDLTRKKVPAKSIRLRARDDSASFAGEEEAEYKL